MSYKFKSGVWEGFYTLQQKKRYLLLNMNFKYGNGTDDYLGSFSIQGEYKDQAPYPVSFTWNFGSGTSMKFTGWREGEKGGVFGTWEGTPGSGTFAFNPSKDTEAAKRFKESAQQATKAQLKSMGFPDWLIEQAVQHADGLEAAINWCTEQSMGGSGGGHEVVDISEEKVAQLVSMGFDAEMAQHALLQTNGNVEAAANWLFEH